jgi:hypothetical protein
MGYYEQGAELLHQQCWYWGRDILSAHGNLLLEGGFERTRPPEGVTASSRYEWKSPCGYRVTLWAFGVVCSLDNEHGIYVNRYQFSPRWVEAPAEAAGQWKAELFQELPPPMTRQQLRETRRHLRWLLRWLAGYEEDILRRYGLEYRRGTLTEWPHYALLPERMPHYWREMSWHIPEPEIAWRWPGRCDVGTGGLRGTGNPRGKGLAVIRHRATGG